MANIAKWIDGAVTFSAANLADNTAMASRSNGYFNIAQVSAADVVIDNATNKDLYLGVEILLGSWTPTITDVIELYALYALDGTNYETGSSTYLPTSDHLLRAAMISTDTSAAGKRLVVWAPILKFKVKILWRWKGTNATAASGNQMSYVTFNENLNG